MTREEYNQLEDRMKAAYNVSTWAGANFPANQRKSISEGFMRGVRWADQHPKSPWISMEERLPDLFDHYYVHTKEGLYGIAFFAFGGFTTDGEVDYWMPIPELPTTK